jgi:hypothetical protein
LTSPTPFSFQEFVPVPSFNNGDVDDDNNDDDGNDDDGNDDDDHNNNEMYLNRIRYLLLASHH